MKLSPITNEAGAYIFYCPGCKTHHKILAGPDGPWRYNGNYLAPSVTPSVLVRTGHYAPGFVGKQCWCTYSERRPNKLPPYKCTRCHFYLTNGRIEYLTDSTHFLAGLTVDMHEI